MLRRRRFRRRPRRPRRRQPRASHLAARGGSRLRARHVRGPMRRCRPPVRPPVRRLFRRWSAACCVAVASLFAALFTCAPFGDPARCGDVRGGGGDALRRRARRARPAPRGRATARGHPVERVRRPTALASFAGRRARRAVLSTRLIAASSSLRCRRRRVILLHAPRPPRRPTPRPRSALRLGLASSAPPAGGTTARESFSFYRSAVASAPSSPANVSGSVARALAASSRALDALMVGSALHTFPGRLARIRRRIDAGDESGVARIWREARRQIPARSIPPRAAAGSGRERDETRAVHVGRGTRATPRAVEGYSQILSGLRRWNRRDRRSLHPKTE